MALETEIIDPQGLSPIQRSTLIDHLYALNCQIFTGVERDVFERYLVGPSALRSRIQVVRDHGEPVGYTAIQSYEMKTFESRPLVIRCVAGMLPAYRRRTLFGWFMAYEGLRLRLANPGRPIYGFACPVHPTTYLMLDRYAVDIWPHREKQMPQEVETLMHRLAARFGMTPEPDYPGVCHVGWCTIQDQQETRQWTLLEHPACRYFVSRNPRYTEGYGLLMLVKLRPWRIGQAMLKLALKRLRSRRYRLWTPA